MENQYLTERMNKFYYILTSVLLSCLVSCAKQDTVYKEFVVNGGRVYPAKVVNASVAAGYQRIIISWEAPMDPSLKSAKLFWDNRTQSRDFEYSDYPSGRIETTVEDLEDRSYTFEIVNYDAAGNSSLAEELTTSPFGDGWLVSHADRSVSSALVNYDTGVATVTMTNATDEMVLTKIRYVNTNGETVESEEIPADKNVIEITDAQQGKFFEYKSAYIPDGGVDVVWSANWLKSNFPFCYNVDRKSATVTVTANQIRESFVPSLILDGIKDNGDSRWYSSNAASYRSIFPKIILIDTHLTGNNAMTFTHFKFYEDPDPDGQTRRYIRSVNIYVSDTKFNVDAGSNFSTTFGEPVLSKSLNQLDAEQLFTAATAKSGRYIAIVFRSSYNSTGFIDLWEFEAYGYCENKLN